MLSSALSALDDRADNFQRDDRPARGAGGRGRRRGGSKGSTGPGGGAGGGEDQRDILLSKKLSYVLRHGAKKEGLSIDEGGWVRVEDLLQWRVLRSMKATVSDLEHVVETNAKKRFEMSLIPEPASDAVPSVLPASTNPDIETSDTPFVPAAQSSSTSSATYRIRATQGHSMDDVQTASLLTPLDTEGAHYVVHGTDRRAWSAIRTSGGLSRMGRRHVHFATGTGDAAGDAAALSELRTTVSEQATGEAASALPQTHSATAPAGPDGALSVVISGMRASARVLVWVDVRRSAQSGGLVWWRSANGVVLTEGDHRGMVPMEYVAFVEERAASSKNAAETRKVLWRRGDE